MSETPVAYKIAEARMEINGEGFTQVFLATASLDIDRAFKNMQDYLAKVGTLVFDGSYKLSGKNYEVFSGVYHVPRETASTVSVSLRELFSDEYRRGHYIYTVGVAVFSSDEQESKQLLEDILDSSDDESLIGNKSRITITQIFS